MNIKKDFVQFSKGDVSKTEKTVHFKKKKKGGKRTQMDFKNKSILLLGPFTFFLCQLSESFVFILIVYGLYLLYFFLKWSLPSSIVDDKNK